MGDFPNVATQFKSGSNAVENGRKGGLVLSAEKKLKLKLNGLRKRGLTDENAKELYDIVTDPDMDTLDIRMWLQSIKSKTITPNERINLSNAMVGWHKAHFGEKTKAEILSMNVNITADEWNRRMNELKRRKENV